MLHPACPTTCPKNLIYVVGLANEDLYTEKKLFVVLPFVMMSKTNTTKQTIVKPNITGALKDNCNFFVFVFTYITPLPFIN